MNSEPKPFLPYCRQTITEADIDSVVRVLRSPCLSQGLAVPTFEQVVAARVGISHGIAVNSATSALHIASLALGLGPGDRLWTSPITFVASANCYRYCGAEFDFLDIDPATGLMSVSALAAKLEQAERYGFAVLEDASHAIGGRYQGEPVGNCRHSIITGFSFHPVKIITTGEGGLATTNDLVLA
jgi:dTDP-4-amino-4,6-dideoxygalactose transaminase